MLKQASTTLKQCFKFLESVSTELSSHIFDQTYNHRVLTVWIDAVARVTFECSPRFMRIMALVAVKSAYKRFNGTPSICVFSCNWLVFFCILAVLAMLFMSNEPCLRLTYIYKYIFLLHKS